MARRMSEASPVLSAHSFTTQSRVHTPSSSVPTTPIIPERPPSPEKKALHDSNAFLTALAAQERRVLELKEELQRAEANLEKLKKQWAVHETTKKRNELRQVEPLQPFSAPPSAQSITGDQEPASVNREQERRKLRSQTTRQPQRTVFSGSRHTKTLSLLSPQKSSAGDHAISVGTTAPSKAPRGTTDGPPRSNTVPELSSAPKPVSNGTNLADPRLSVNGLPKDPILDAGKQLMGDFKEGFWTFFEDLRQATVGEDLIDTTTGSVVRRPANDSTMDTAGKATTLQRDNATKSQFPARQSSLLRAAKYSENRILRASETSKETTLQDKNPVLPSITPKHKRNLTIETTPADPDGWDSWDSPPSNNSLPRSSTSTYNAGSLASPTTDHGSPCTSLSSVDATPRPAKPTTERDERKEIPWPVITKLSPGKLVRTASTLMTEWERSLASPPSENVV